MNPFDETKTKTKPAITPDVHPFARPEVAAALTVVNSDPRTGFFGQRNAARNIIDEAKHVLATLDAELAPRVKQRADEREAARRQKQAADLDAKASDLEAQADRAKVEKLEKVDEIKASAADLRAEAAKLRG